MSEKEYAVIVKKGVDIEEFDAEMAASQGHGPVPNRSVDVANPRLGSGRMTHWMITDEEAESLRSDPRVEAVEIPPYLRDDIHIGLRASQTGNFYRGTLGASTEVNWGLKRSIAETNTYFNQPTIAGNYEYALDGSGVDIVIQDSGLQVDHPDFNDYVGNSRVQQINWYTESGLPGTQSANHYRDYEGHGTHCAGIAAGLTYGWAKGARIYSQKLSGLEGPGDSGTGISVADAFDSIRLWHIAKGGTRPTIVNMSWGYFSSSTVDPTSGEYRGISWNYGDPNYSTITELWANAGIVPPFDVDGTSVRYFTNTNAFANAEVEDMIDAGIHVCIAAGNDYYKLDVSGGLDYDNFAVFSGTQQFYHRSGSPYSSRAFYVGNIDSTVQNDSGTYRDKTASSSNKGPAVNIWAPGTNIMSTTSTVNDGYTTVNYPNNTSYKITSISGTSMASPQVAGVCALYLQATPDISTDDLLTKIINDSKSVIYDTGVNNDYASYQTSIMGAPNRMLYSKYGRQPVIYKNVSL